MDEKKLVKLLKEHFPTKKEFNDLKGSFPTKKEYGLLNRGLVSLCKDFDDFSGFVAKNAVTKTDLKKEFGNLVAKTEFTDFKLEMYEFKKETKETLRSIDEHLEGIDDKLNELKSSSNVFDQILIEYPIERIKRLEKYSKLSPYKPTVSV